MPTEFNEQLFDVYSQNLSQVKRHPLINFHPDIDDSYVCPMCYRIYTRDELFIPNVLTIDHIPPEKLGGKRSNGILMCQPCNNNLGSQLDSQLKRIMDANDFLSLTPGATSSGWFSMTGNTKITADLEISEDGTLIIQGDPKRTNPAHLNKEKEHISNIQLGEQIHGKAQFTVGKVRLADIAALRIAYLYLFRMFGYAAIAYPAMMSVREQIMNSEEHILPHKWMFPAEAFPDESLGVNLVTAPQELQSFLVVFDLERKKRRRYAVILPKHKAPSISIYSWLEEQAPTNVSLEFSHWSEAKELLTLPENAFAIHQV